MGFLDSNRSQNRSVRISVIGGLSISSRGLGVLYTIQTPSTLLHVNSIGCVYIYNDKCGYRAVKSFRMSIVRHHTYKTDNVSLEYRSFLHASPLIDSLDNSCLLRVNGHAARSKATSGCFCYHHHHSRQTNWSCPTKHMDLQQVLPHSQQATPSP